MAFTHTAEELFRSLPNQSRLSGKPHNSRAKGRLQLTVGASPRVEHAQVLRALNNCSGQSFSASSVMEIKIDEHIGVLLAHPTGVFDVKLAEEIIHFIEVWEVVRQEGFDRFCDLRGLESIRLSASEIRQIATRRRLFNPNQVPVRTAFLADTPIAFATVAIYQDLLNSPRITVRSFRSIADASGWLRVEPGKLRG